jgi:hypothetical protein
LMLSLGSNLYRSGRLPQMPISLPMMIVNDQVK